MAPSSKQKTGTDALLSWCQKHTAGYKNVKVKDFDNSWADGLAFCALLHYFRPDLLDFAQLSPANRPDNLRLAFTKAESIGIPALIDVEDMLPPVKPDKFSVITYLTQFFHAFAETGEPHRLSRAIKPINASSSSTTTATATANSASATAAAIPPPKLAFNTPAQRGNLVASRLASIAGAGAGASNGSAKGGAKGGARASVMVGAGAQEDRPSCSVCAKPITGATVQAIGNVYHQVVHSLTQRYTSTTTTSIRNAAPPPPPPPPSDCNILM
jgi:hypothetical protein